MKKAISILLSLLMVLSAFSVMPFSASADEPKSGTCGTNAVWTLDGEGLLTVSGSGQMTGWTSNAVPWAGYRNSIKEVIVESGITKIGNWSFAKCPNLTKITVADTVTQIYPFAMSG
ncbi:MAG: leucine-rich repeat domain-containing protein, partial [Eubacterium sp.]|nr:leucine-rich repeat domain-containing protein [Eubacterium sp.]